MVADAQRVHDALPAVDFLDFVEKQAHAVRSSVEPCEDVVVERFGVAERQVAEVFEVVREHGGRIGAIRAQCFLHLREEHGFPAAPQARQHFHDVLVEKRPQAVDVTFALNHAITSVKIILFLFYTGYDCESKRKIKFVQI